MYVTSDKASAQSGTIMVDEEDENENLVDEQEDLSRVLDYYEKKFKAKIGIMPAVVETDEIEMDLIVDMDSDLVLGMRIFQFIPVEEEGEEGEESAKEEPKSAKKAGEKEDEEDEEVDDGLYDVLIYDLTRSENAKVKVPGEPILEVEVGAPECEEGEDDEAKAPQKPAAASKPPAKPAAAAKDEEKFWVHIAVFMKENDDGAELTGATMYYIDKPKTKIAFLPNPDLG
jgi:hypothetical protein